ncbi:FHA domain-containing protein [Solirubrobacter soli]|uniref:FHA domain-containing protein n=1 Tax=Solirubrobacter soli TaxID=363832 RepID=UPI0003FE7CF3|nr:FHA domain-containing protein [Solirubrobacter soli]
MFLAYRDPDGLRQLYALPSALSRVTIGRRSSCDVALPWDDQVSRVHAELLRMGDAWVVCDDGLSHNGTYVNGRRVHGRRRLIPGDVLRVGASTLTVGEQAPTAATTPTRPAGADRELPRVTPAQRRLLEALHRGDGSAPPSNREIAAELGISIDTVKGTLSVLYERFGLEHLPQNAKRAALAALSDSRSE